MVPNHARIRPVQSMLVLAQSYYLKEQCSLLVLALERESCILDGVPASLSMLMLLWHFWSSDKKKPTTVQYSETSHSPSLWRHKHRQARTHCLNQDENVQRSADSKEILLLTNQKDYLILPHMNGNQAEPSPLSLSLSLCLHQLHIHRSAEQQHILPMQNSNYFSPLGGEYTHEC